jgi:hypothetical protein
MVAASDAQIGGQQDALLEHFHLDDFDSLSRSHDWPTFVLKGFRARTLYP